MPAHTFTLTNGVRIEIWVEPDDATRLHLIVTDAHGSAEATARGAADVPVVRQVLATLQTWAEGQAGGEGAAQHERPA